MASANTARSCSAALSLAPATRTSNTLDRSAPRRRQPGATYDSSRDTAADASSYWTRYSINDGFQTAKPISCDNIEEADVTGLPTDQIPIPGTVNYGDPKPAQRENNFTNVPLKDKCIHVNATSLSEDHLSIQF